MMKKFLAILLCVSMLLGCAALAETEKASLGVVNVNGAFELKCALPEGYSLEVLFSETHFCLASVNPEDETKPTLMISVAYNELYSDVERINDLAVRSGYSRNELLGKLLDFAVDRCDIEETK